MNPTPKRAVIYARISRDDNEVGGYSDRAHERQIEACQNLAKSRGWEVVEVVKEKRSAYAHEDGRPEWDRVLGMMRAHQVDVVLAWKIDRLTRRVKVLLDLVQVAEETGVDIVTTDGHLDLTTPTGQAVATILSVIAQLEVNLKAQRQIAANKQAAKRGEPFKSGWRAFGYGDDKTEIREDEAELIRKGAKDALAGKPLRQIARDWREAGLTSPRSSSSGKGWTHQGVKSVLLNPRNAGFATYKGEVVGRGQWTPILDDGTYHQLVAMLRDPARRTNHTSAGPGRPPQNLLSGIARCGVCGETVHGRRHNGKPTYTCPTEHLSTHRPEADEYVTMAMRFEALIAKKGSTFYTTPIRDASELEADLEALTRREKRIAERYGAQEIDDAQFDAATVAARSERERILGEIADIERDTSDRNALTRMRRWDSMPLAEARGVLQRATEITLFPKYHRKNVDIAHQVAIFVRKPDHTGLMHWHCAGGEHPDVESALKESRTIWGGTPVDTSLRDVIRRNDEIDRTRDNE